MKRNSTPSYVVTLPLRCEPWQKDRLNRVFKAANVLYNNLVADRKRALVQLQRTKAWRTNDAAIASVYAQSKENSNELLKPLFQMKADMLAAAGFSEYSFQQLVQKWRKHYKPVIGTHVAQKIASAAWDKFEDYFFGNGKEIRFRSIDDCLTIEGKTNGTNLFYKDGYVFVAKSVKIPIDLTREALNDYEYEALYAEDGKMRRIKYCRIKRATCNRGWRYFIQFVMEGTHPVKKTKDGKPLHPIGSGSVGLDIGPQTLAVVSDSDVKLHLLARGAQNLENQLRRINRAMDRSRRANNPEFFNQKTGEVIHKDKLKPEQLTKSGNRRWNNSKSYKRLQQRRRTMLYKQAELRIQRHQELANIILSQGNRFVVEDMDFRALAKKAKEAKKSEKIGKYHSRKRFGKSIANRAPASFVNILERKVSEYGGVFCRVSTFKTKASQYNHITDEYHKKKLSARWDVMPDGTKVQRDLYSAYLLQHVDDTQESYDKDSLKNDFAAFLVLHAQEIERLKTTDMPSSCGMKKL